MTRLFDETGSDQKIHAHILLRFQPFAHVALPRGEMIDPTHHAIVILSQFSDLERGSPSIIGDEYQRRLLPFFLLRMTVAQDTSYDVVPVRE